MDYSKLPKHRGFGPGSAVGAKEARFLDTIDAPYLQHNLPDGTVARKSGFGQLSVTPGEFEDTLLDGYYSLGRIAGQTRILGSLDCRSFRDRGPAPQAGGFNVAQLGFYGRGLGQVFTSASAADRADFDGRAAGSFRSTIYRTRTGRQLVPYGIVQQYERAWGRPYTNVTVLTGGYRQVGDTARFCAATVGVGIASSQYHLICYTDDGVNMAEVIGPSVPNQIMWYPDAGIVSPGVYAAMVRFVRPEYTPTASTPAACPGLKLYLSSDAGASWAEAAAPIWQQEMASLMGMPPTLANAAIFNTAIGYSLMVLAPLSATRTVAFVLMPYVVPAGSGFEIRTKLKMGLMVGGTLTETQTLFDGSPTVGRAIFRDAAHVNGGVLLLTYQESGDPRGQPLRVRFTADGAALQELPATPFAAYRTGGLSSIDRRRLALPMFDGEHALYSTTDGQTWARRATITDKAPAPALDYVLNDFGILTGLRRDGRAMPVMATSPWATDCRFAAPPP